MNCFNKLISCPCDESLLRIHKIKICKKALKFMKVFSGSKTEEFEKLLSLKTKGSEVPYPQISFSRLSLTYAIYL